MNERQSKILTIIIMEHIRTGQPVSSGLVAAEYGLSVSPATVRNDMAELEEEGFIYQPHTSSGRVPSEKGYKEYLKALKPKKVSKKEGGELSVLIEAGGQNNYKEAAKLLSRMSGQAVFWAFHKHDLFYTGISNLLSQPEFSRMNAVYDISLIIDRVDEIISRVFDDLGHATNIFIGSENPFGNFCGSIISKYSRDGRDGLIGLLGPMRMDYEKNLGLVEYLSSRVSKGL
jgi:transcriptional regulator of heat shock response